MTYSAEVLADSPAAYYRLAESSGTTAADSSGNSRNGTYVGSPTLGQTSGVGDGSDSSVQFGASKYVDVASASWMTGGGGEFSAEAWVYPTSSSAIAIVGRHESGCTFDIQLSSLTVQFRWQVSGIGFVVLNSPGTIPTNAWTHVVGTYDGTTRRLYLNGSEVANDVPGPTAYPSGNDLAIGSLSNGFASQWFVGNIDEVAIYPAALSSGRVAAHYAAGSSVSPSGTIGLTVPAPTVALTGTAAVTASLGLTIPAPIVALSEAVEPDPPWTVPVGLIGLSWDAYGLLEFDPVTGGGADVPLHVVSPSVPVPTLVDGRPV